MHKMAPDSQETEEKKMTKLGKQGSVRGKPRYKEAVRLASVWSVGPCHVCLPWELSSRLHGQRGPLCET